MKVWSEAFKYGEFIPIKFTCDGKNISPSLSWSDIPDGCHSLTLICDDPDAPGNTWVHWVVFNIPSGEKELPENFSQNPARIHGVVEGTNSWGRKGYGGPCPPPGEHRYFFKLYALNEILYLDSKAKKTDLLKAMQSHILAEAETMGRYSR